MKNPKICLIASSGGHLYEISRLNKIIKDYDSFIVTEDITNLDLSNFKNSYRLKLMNRKEFFFIFKYIKLCIKSRRIYKKEHPDIIISTGALICYTLLKIMHKHHKKVIYIESYARVYDLSLTAKKAYKFADLFIVQHKELQNKYPRAVYDGNLFGEII